MNPFSFPMPYFTPEAKVKIGEAVIANQSSKLKNMNLIVIGLAAVAVFMFFKLVLKRKR